MIVRIEGVALALNPDVKIIAPVRNGVWDRWRDQYAKTWNPVRQTSSNRIRTMIICGCDRKAGRLKTRTRSSVKRYFLGLLFGRCAK
jgi:hypothetical protein